MQVVMAQLGIPLLRHNFREANSVAHLLARDRIKLKLMNKTIIHHASTQLVEATLKDDADGRLYGRLISEQACNRLASMGNVNAVHSTSTFVNPLSFNPNGMAEKFPCNVT
ncbi:hypothetical protein A4A49_01448 [Nicotiana attenuata]|uniref:Uncharacterized protein n=1 Tax=Nicotiana attenuata TaxID=49451 RepID=A0A1J6I660_NICAT|nr:hypothetical protein A4A49_01448 [Nicotiana attenuata]